MEDKEKSDEQSSEFENELDQSKEKPNWFICFFKVLANVYFNGFIGKDLITGEKASNRFLCFVDNVFCLIIQSLHIALFVSYFLITLPTWIFVLAIVRMALELLDLVYRTNQAKKSLAKRQKPIKYSEDKQHLEEEVAKNHAKCYQYGAYDTFYVYR